MSTSTESAPARPRKPRPKPARFIGLALPFSVRFFTSFRVPISGLSAIIAIVSLSIAGIVAGIFPARKAALLPPVEALRQE